MIFNIRDYVSDDHVESIGEIAKSQSAIIQALSLENSKLETQLQQKDKEIERLKKLCDKYEEEHKTTFEEWKKTIAIIDELEKVLDENVELTYVHNGIRQYNKTLTEGGLLFRDYIKSKLQELKGSDKE